MKTLPSVLALVMLCASSASAVTPTVSITTCGQVVPKRTVGILAADLDCTGYTGGYFGTAINAEQGATVDLGGFTVTGGRFGIGCFTPCSNGNPDCFDSSNCTVRNGTVQSSENTGIIGGNIKVQGVTVQNHGDRGVDGGRQITITDSTITGNAVAGALAAHVNVRGSTISDNGRFGVGTTAIGRVTVKESTLTGNHTDVVCSPPTAVVCADISSARHPGVRATTCERSYSGIPRPDSHCGAHSWCVCSDDHP